MSRASGSLVAPKDRLSATIPVVPTTARVFQPIDRSTVFLRVYQGGPGPVAPVHVRFRVIDVRDFTVVDETETLGPDRFAKGRAAEVQRALPLERLTPGEYLLSFEVKRGETVARRDMRFVVQ